MAYICDRCEKGKLNGNLVSHSGRRSKRRFKPNLHAYWVKVDSRYIKGKFCTKCLRILKSQNQPQVQASV